MLRELIKEFEGLRLKPYVDTRGYLTIGYGRCLDKKGITLAEANDFLDDDLADVREGLTLHLPWTETLDQVRYEVLACMAYQLGIDGLLGFKKMFVAIQAADYDAAAKEMLDSDWHKQTPYRAEKLAAMMISGIVAIKS